MEDIKEILKEKEGDLAFLIGNGINLHYFKEETLDWKTLLSVLWKDFCKGEKVMPKGNVSYTEIFDLIELETYDNKNYNLVDIEILQKLQNERKNDIEKIIKDIKPDNNLDLNASIKNYVIKLQEENAIKKICDAIKENTENISSLEIGDILSDIINIKRRTLQSILKIQIVNKYKEKVSSEPYKKLLEKIKEKKIPILTTNFDDRISKTLELKKSIIKGAYKFTDFYPWNVCFAKKEEKEEKELEKPIDGFGVWHINGVVEYPRSIRIGLSDYMGSVEHARKGLFKNLVNNENTWKFRNTWLDIFFKKYLFIFGLSLDENETFLRWLLIQRAKYAKITSKELKGCYVDIEISEGKKTFFECIGFEVIDLKYKDYDIFMTKKEYIKQCYEAFYEFLENW